MTVRNARQKRGLVKALTKGHHLPRREHTLTPYAKVMLYALEEEKRLNLINDWEYVHRGIRILGKDRRACQKKCCKDFNKAIDDEQRKLRTDES